ncbi:MAG TPA: hypothetical protein VHZ76_09275, partial [Gammaproteobacteria bacterium]|nr:hypothetical protein [Gammaproteobacteria bacterium]
MTRQLETKKTKFRRIKSNVLDDHSLISISKDTDAQYVINSKNFANIKQATFFDRNEKIFEISNQQDNITLNIFTSKPLNIFGNIDANIILIQSLGKLQFNGQINTKYLNIDAKAVDFEQLVNCSGGANINVKDDLIFKEKLKGGFLNCSAENIFLKRQITAQDDINLLARKVIDIKEGLRSRGKINLKSDDIALYGVFIAKKVTLVAQKKIENNANIQVVKNIKIKAVDIKHNGRIYSYGECHIKARQNLFCTKNSKIEVSKHFTARAIASGLYGYLNVKQGCEIKAQSLDTDNAIYCTGYIHINVIEWYCYQGSNINIQHTDPLEKSNIAVKNIFLSEYGSHIHAYAAPLIIELFQKQQLKSLPLTFSAKRLEANGKFLLEYAMILGERLIVKEKAAIAINRAWFQVEFIVVDGEFSCQHSQLDATRVAYEKNSTTQCQYVDINVNNEFLVDGSAALINSAVEAKYTEFSGDLLLVNVGVKSKDAIFYPYSVKGEQLSIDTEQLGLHSNPNKKWTFKNLIANTKVLEVEGDCTLIESKINVHDNKVSSNNGRLHLHDSFIITDGHFFNNKNAKLIVTQSKPSSEIQQQANVDTKQIYNQGDIQITAATLKSEIIIHVGNKFKAIQSTIDVSKDLSIDEQAKLSLTEHSFLTGNPELLLRKATLTLKKGSQLEANKIFAASGSKAKFDESYAKVKDKLLIQDKLKIKNSVLTAKQLDLMKAGQINTNAALIEVENTRLVGELAAKKTQLNIGENILVCPDGQMKLTSTHLQGKEMEFQGHLHVAAVPRNVSIVYPENNQEFDQQVAEWKNGHGVDDILFIFSPELKIWNAVQIQKDKELNKTEIQSDSPFFSELQHITRKNVATYDKKQIQLMLANTVTFKLKKLKTTFESTIEGDSLSTLTDYWTHEGQLRLTERWYGRGKQLLVDEGNIQTGERIDSGFDSFFNSGSLSTKHMSNKAGLLINLGWMRADFMNNASFLCLNGGVMNAYHLQNNALVQFNYGLMLPSLPTNPRELLSKNTLKIFGKSVLCSVAPQLSSAINFAFALPDACSFAKTAWENLSFEKLEETGKKLKEMPIYELADHACQVNNFLTSTINFGLRAKSAIDNWEEHWQNGVQTYNAVKQTNFSSLKSNLSTAASSISFDKIMNVSKQGAKIGASVIGPTCSNNSFYSSNNGVTFSHNVHESSFFYSNNSFEAALDSITVNSAFQYNQGNIS